MQKAKVAREGAPIYKSLSGKDLDLLIEVYEEHKRVAIARALEGVSLDFRRRPSPTPTPLAYPPPLPAPG